MKIKKRQHENNPAQFWFHCPGCGFSHSFGESWSFNGDYDNPTISPSILVTAPGRDNYRCHSFIKNGQIQFLKDCTHNLAGQTVELPEYNEAGE